MDAVHLTDGVELNDMCMWGLEHSECIPLLCALVEVPKRFRVSCGHFNTS
jgi:hypothetical protein